MITVTLNPAIDRVIEVPGFAVGQHAKGQRIGWYPAGKGINVSRVLARLGIRSIATGFVGKGELVIFEDFLRDQGRGRITTQLLVVHGRTRDNFTIQDPIADTETHVRDDGFTVHRADVRRIVSKVGLLASGGRLVCISGSAPPGVCAGDIRSIIHRCNDAQARVVLDSSVRLLPSLRGERIWMAKLNPKELEAYSGMPTKTEAQTIAAARSVATPSPAQSGAEWVLATRGEHGAILIGPGTQLKAWTVVHPGMIRSTVGCGDTLLAGVLKARTNGQGWEQALACGVGAATANAVARTPIEISDSDIEHFTAQAKIEPLS